MSEIRGRQRRSRVGAIVAGLIIAAAAGLWLRTLSGRGLTTDDASIDGEVVHVAPLVGGRIIELPVHENQLVHIGDLLFRIDPASYETSVASAQANLAIARASVSWKNRLVTTQRWNSQTAAEQTIRARENLELAQRTQDRLTPLAAKGYIPEQQLDQARTATADAAVSLAQAGQQQSAAVSAIDTDNASLARVRAAEATLANARRTLADTSVFAAHDGRIVGLNVSTGEIVAPSQALFTLISTENWFASANIRETDLDRVRPGACALVYSMIDRRRAIRGVVDSVGYGVVDSDKVNLPRAAPYVQASLNWVRVAQRFPVRIRLNNPPEELMKLGASAVVEVAHDSGCK
jgi:multidrug efflux system membrane fusion protein